MGRLNFRNMPAVLDYVTLAPVDNPNKGKLALKLEKLGPPERYRIIIKVGTTSSGPCNPPDLDQPFYHIILSPSPAPRWRQAAMQIGSSPPELLNRSCAPPVAAAKILS
jgi:hypothetical protein